MHINIVVFLCCLPSPSPTSQRTMSSGWDGRRRSKYSHSCSLHSTLQFNSVQNSSRIHCSWNNTVKRRGRHQMKCNALSFMLLFISCHSKSSNVLRLNITAYSACTLFQCLWLGFTCNGGGCTYAAASHVCVRSLTTTHTSHLLHCISSFVYLCHTSYPPAQKHVRTEEHSYWDRTWFSRFSCISINTIYMY